MPKPSEKLVELGIELPPVAKPVAAYTHAVRTGNLVFTAGQLPSKNGVLVLEGIVGDTVSAEDAAAASRVSALNAVAAVAAECGGIDNIRRIVKVTCFVASVPTFTAQSGVSNGASELLMAIFGEAGVHARTTISTPCLPRNSPVEVEIVAEVV